MGGAAVVGLWIGDALFRGVHGLPRDYPVVREVLLLAAAVASTFIGWPNARRWARVLACVLCVVAIPVRYQLLQTAHGVRSLVDASNHGSQKGNL
jgi:hypothetical protein